MIDLLRRTLRLKFAFSSSFKVKMSLIESVEEVFVDEISEC